jgi:hypothetical protein
VFDWKNQSIDLINELNFKIVDPGPLHAPVYKFKIRRDEKLDLFIETEAAIDAKSSAQNFPSGTIRFSTETVKIEHPFSSAKGELIGIETLELAQVEGKLQEIATFHELTLTLFQSGPAAYTIEWIDNFPQIYLWPDSVNTITENSTRFTLANEGDEIIIREDDHRRGGGQSAARLVIDAHVLHVCAPSRNSATRSGCIVYVGVPDQLLRKKIRTALSLALGAYLIETGHTVYDAKWHIVSAVAISAYSLGQAAFNLPPMPLTLLTDRNLQFDIGRPKLQRMVERLCAAYESLDLANLSWAYWHARTATVHIAPAHFGAAIEALQEAYSEKHPDAIRRSIVPKPKWKEMMKGIDEAVAKASIPDDEKVAITEAIRGGINRTSARERTRELAKRIKIEIGPYEDAAWQRRNDAAHGTTIPEGEELEAIQDMKLLMVLFHRLLLAVTGAADLYVDYATPGHPWRPLKDAVPPAVTPEISST